MIEKAFFIIFEGLSLKQIKQDKVFFIIFKGLSLKQMKQFFLEGDSQTLIVHNLLIMNYLNLIKESLQKQLLNGVL